MNDPRSQPPDSNNDDEHAPLEVSDAIVDEGWAALDHLLSRNVPRLSHEQLQRVADGVRRRRAPPQPRRPRLKWALVAASLVIAVVGLSWVVSETDEPSRPEASHQVAAPSTPEVNEVAWDDDWSTALASAYQHFDDVEADWRDTERSWMGLQVQINDLEEELTGVPSL